MSHVSFTFRSFKTTPRSQNAHAYVTAAFSAKVASPSSDLTVEERPFLAYGGISGGFVRAANTERFLVGKKLDDPQGVSGFFYIEFFMISQPLIL